MRITAVGTASPDLAWERYDDPLGWPEWSPQIRRVDCESHELVVGLTGVVHPVLGPTVHFTVTAVDRRTRTWSWSVGRGPVRLATQHGVTGRPEGCEAWMDLRTTVGLLYLPLAKLALMTLATAPAPGS